jgi:hypothetical protein
VGATTIEVRVEACWGSWETVPAEVEGSSSSATMEVAVEGSNTTVIGSRAVGPGSSKRSSSRSRQAFIIESTVGLVNREVHEGVNYDKTASMRIQITIKTDVVTTLGVGEWVLVISSSTNSSKVVAPDLGEWGHGYTIGNGVLEQNSILHTVGHKDSAVFRIDNGQTNGESSTEVGGEVISSGQAGSSATLGASGIDQVQGVISAKESRDGTSSNGISTVDELSGHVTPTRQGVNTLLDTIGIKETNGVTEGKRSVAQYFSAVGI